MCTRALFIAVAASVATASAWGQAVTQSPQSPVAASQAQPAPTTWRGVGADPTVPEMARQAPAAAPEASSPGQPAAGSTAEAPRGRIARVTTGSGQLPNQAGQLWREYDISPYTMRVASTARPEQAIIDWILRDTGYEVWHGEPLAILSAPNPRTLVVYHTPEMQEVVAEIVDRFVSTEAQTQTFGVRVVSLSHPNWRARAQGLVQPVQVQTPGVQAWLLQKEDSAVLLAELQRRSDYREHSSPHLMVNNGQSAVVSATRGLGYVKGVAMRTDGWPGLQPETAVVDEGFSLEFSPLLSVDGQVIDATIKCEIDQVEKMVSVPLEVSGSAAGRQRAKIDVPQMSHFHFHERFRWPVEQVLLVGFGMVPLPVPTDGQQLVAGLPLPLPASPPRADVLVFVESQGRTGQAKRLAETTPAAARTYRGRY